jgi:uncharacterized protein YbjT (DUF2867 family)
MPTARASQEQGHDRTEEIQIDPILVTGGTGTLGRLVVRRLREAGREVLDGRVIAPDGAGYDEARAVFYGGMDRPATLQGETSC